MERLHEDTITTEVKNLLRDMTHGWTFSEQQKPFEDSQKSPDLMAKRFGRETVAFEAKLETTADDGITKMQDDYLGSELKTAYLGVSETLQAGIVMYYPDSIAVGPDEELVKRLVHAEDIGYCVMNTTAEGNFPAEGFAKGSVRDIAIALEMGAMPAKKIQEIAEKMATGIHKAREWLEQSIANKPIIGEKLIEILGKSEMRELCGKACLILTDAFIFQDAVQGKEGFDDVKPLDYYGTNPLQRDAVMNDWAAILGVNYAPIFLSAHQMIDEAFVFDRGMSNRVLNKLWTTAVEITNSHLPQIHELAGEIFQTLIEDREYVKANYTLPESAALLSALVCPDINITDEMSTEEALDALPMCADFACGTGSLINGVYKQVRRLYELKTGRSAEEIHKHMMEELLGGVDIYPHATHLTFMCMASAFPHLPIGKTRVLTAECGYIEKDDVYATGALDLLNEEQLFHMFAFKADQVGGKAITPTELNDHFEDSEMDIVIMNPPFLVDTADPNSINMKRSFDAKGRSDTVRANLNDALGQKATEYSDGKLKYSYFVELAHNKLRDGGRMGFVLPATVLAASGFQKVRELWATYYHNVLVVTIAQNRVLDSAFSADTNMAECLVVADKGVGENTGRATFVSLNERPMSNLAANKLANQILNIKSAPRLEDTPHGGAVMDIGDTRVAQSLNCPISGEEWGAARTRSLSLQQTAHRLRKGKLHLPLQPISASIPMCRIGDIAVVNYDSRQINSPDLGAFSFRDTYQISLEGYPSLKRVISEHQRAMLTRPNAELRKRVGKEAQAERVLARNSRTHYYRYLRFNSNSQLANFTAAPSIGTSLITNVQLETPRYDAAWTLWTNSTFGLLSHWVSTAQQQGARGLVTLKTIVNVPTLDVRQLSDAQLAAAERVFDEMKMARMLPYHRCADDAWRHILDARLLAEVLGITDEATHRAMQKMREMLCAEPSIAGTSKKQHDLEAEREAHDLPGTAAEDAQALATQQLNLSILGIYLPANDEGCD